MKTPTHLCLWLGTFALAATSCGSSSDSSGGAIVGLSLPDSMDLIGIEEETAGSSIAAGASVNPAAVFSNTSDFHTDIVRAYMWDETTEPLNIINEILTSVGQTRADHFVNTGPYLALVEEVGGDADSGGNAAGQSSSGNATVLEPWILNSTRASASAAQVVRFWITDEEDFGPAGSFIQTIFGRATISEEPTDTNPYGDFHLDFGMVNNSDSSLAARGSLSTTNPGGGLLGFTFMMEDLTGFGGDDTRVAVQTSGDQTTGVAHMAVPNFSAGGTVDYTIAYNSDYFLRSDGTDTVLLDRNNFVRNTWGYNLYYAADDSDGHTAGQRVDIEGGFPFIFDNSGTTEFGWVDYWGIWTPNPDALAHGATVTRDNSQGDPVPYTVLRAPGKLIKVTKRSVTLAEMDGESFEYWDWTSGDQFLVQYTHGTTTFSKVSVRDTDTWEWVDLTPAQTLTINLDEYYGFWSQALGGSLDFVGGDTAMTVREQNYVSSDDSIFGAGTSLTLYAMTEALRPGMTAGDVEIGNIYQTEITDPNNAYQYTFLKDGRTLQFGGVDVGLLSGEVPDEGFYTWGMNSGPMSAVDPVTLGITDPWEMYNLDEYYFYETGHNEWNQYATLIDFLGSPVSFDSPISFFYTHTTANDADDSAEHDGKKIFLTYGGERNLWGIPGHEADTNGDGFGDRWYPLFSIKDGAVMGPDGTEFVIKAVEMELFMQTSVDTVPTTLQTALTNAAGLALPTLTGWVNPTTVAQPVVTDEPAVVAGVIQ
ncbi:MAG: hypothetical protein COA70_09780 [Planctomycetota bacterium]|nr:MAG: hypothetical protein COA70_09780 [Planctomycetota bacterium]